MPLAIARRRSWGTHGSIGAPPFKIATALSSLVLALEKPEIEVLPLLEKLDHCSQSVGDR
jgi:hypothetical protein